MDVLHGVNSGSIALIYLDSPLSFKCGYGIWLGLGILVPYGLIARTARSLKDGQVDENQDRLMFADGCVEGQFNGSGALSRLVSPLDGLTRYGHNLAGTADALEYDIRTHSALEGNYGYPGR